MDRPAREAEAVGAHRRRLRGEPASLPQADVRKAHAGLDQSRRGHGVCTAAWLIGPRPPTDEIVTGKALMNFAIKNDLVPKGTGNPFAGIELYPEEGRERFLSADEIGHIGTAIRDLENEGRLSPGTAAALRLLMLTGARSGEIKTCKWEFVDFDRKALLLPKSKTGKKDDPTQPARRLRSCRRCRASTATPYVIVGQIKRAHRDLAAGLGACLPPNGPARRAHP